MLFAPAPPPPFTSGLASQIAPAVARGTSARARQASASVRGAAARAHPLAGKVVGIDPGHNGRNWSDPSFINHLVWNGRELETCDTTGTATNSGYPEAQFNWELSKRLRHDLTRKGAKVVLTRHDNTGVGPCVNRRSQIINRAHANVAIDIHADGGPSWGRGFALLLPVADHRNRHVIRRSYRFAHYLRRRMRKVTGMPISNYDGTHGLQPRNDLAGLNLTTVPKVLIECGNMRNSTDAALLTSRRWRHRAARAMAQAITKYLTGRL